MNTKMNTKIRPLARLGIVLFSLIATTALQAADSIIVYSGRSDKFIKPVLENYTQKTGIKVIVHAGKSTGLLNKLKIEGSRTDADLFISNDAGTLQKGSEMGLFASIPNEIASQIEKNYRADDDTWIGLSARARVLVVNKKSDLANKLNSVFDLANPKLKGKLGITNSTNESYIAGATVYMLATDKNKTQSWLEGMKSNANGKVFNKHSKIVKAVADGKLDVGLVNHYYIFRHFDKHPDAPIKIVLPDQNKDQIGLAWNVAGIAISKHTKKQKLAHDLVKFLVSTEGQKQFAEVNHEYPTRKGVAASAKVPAAGSFKIANVPMYKLGTHRNETIDLIEKVGMP